MYNKIEKKKKNEVELALFYHYKHFEKHVGMSFKLSKNKPSSCGAKLTNVTRKMFVLKYKNNDRIY